MSQAKGNAVSCSGRCARRFKQELPVSPAANGSRPNFAAERAARKAWHIGQRVRIVGEHEYHGETGEIYCIPPAKYPQWLYTVILEEPCWFDCVFCRHDEMEAV